jgi:phospholipid/cholesterol/gamma-HCH transport system substrate-binding protein
MPRRTRWRDLIPGLIALAAIVAAVMGVFMYARLGALHGDTFTLYSATNQARGLMKGSEVWLAGVKVGLVEAIDFRRVTAADTGDRVVIRLDVLSKYREFIRRDGHTQIRNGGTLIGAPVVFMTPGSSAAPAVGEGDTLRAEPQGDAEGISSQIALASRNFPAIIDNVRLLNAQLRTARGTLGAMGVERGEIQLGELRTNTQRLTRRATGGGGTIDGVIGGDLERRVGRSLARVDSLQRALESSRGTVARIRGDSTLLQQVGALRADVVLLQRYLAESRGSAGRAIHDEAVAQQLAAAQRSLTTLMDDIRRRPLRYVNF